LLRGAPIDFSISSGDGFTIDLSQRIAFRENFGRAQENANEKNCDAR